MTDDYTTLASLYDTIGMSDFSQQMIEDILDHALANDWLGQSVMDFGCGTGVAASWLSEDRYNVIGVDQSEQMLAVAREKSGLAEWHQADVRSVGDSFGKTDMVLAFDLLNEMESLKDVSNLFASAYKALNEGMWFAFDAYTIEGLTARGNTSALISHDADGITVFAENQFDYERQAATRTHIVFVEGQDGTWLRQNTQRILRGYPLQVIATLLQRTGFSNVALMDLSLVPVRSDLKGYERLMVIARR